MARDNELREEQAYVDTVYARLDELREETAQKLSGTRLTQVGGNHQNRTERDAFASLYEDQLLRLRNAEDGLCFGRIDYADGGTTYIGRIGISSADRRQLLMDWRAPASEPFYRATAAHPAGLRRRRHIATRGRTVVSIEDDVLDLTALDSAERAELHGEGALIAALDAHRTGRMGDIVQTIQAEQDAIIRKPLEGVVVVQGGPGTGKTAVALHRAAYLLYQHRERIANSGVLLIGPSPVFLKYIEQVLPSLGETGAVLLTPGQLYPGLDVRLRDGVKTAAVKGDLRMAEVIRRAVRNYQRVPDAEQTLKVGLRNVTLQPSQVRAARDRARRTGTPHNQARETFATSLMRELAESMLAQGAPTSADGDPIAELMDEMRLSRDVRIAINSAWLPVSAETLLRSLYAKPHRLVGAADGILSFEEMARLRRSEDEPWTVEDVPLLDEAAELLGPLGGAKAARDTAELDYARQVLEMTGQSDYVSAEALAARYSADGSGLSLADRAAEDREWAYGHLVVDEAQELSPMQFRTLFRRVPTKSATLVGDLAQAEHVDAERDWSQVLAPHVGDRFDLSELSISYRTPGRIMDVANGLLADHFPTLRVPTPVREAAGRRWCSGVRMCRRWRMRWALRSQRSLKPWAAAGWRSSLLRSTVSSSRRPSPARLRTLLWAVRGSITRWRC